MAVSLLEGLQSYDVEIGADAHDEGEPLADLPYGTAARRDARFLRGDEDIRGVLRDGRGDFRMDGRVAGAGHIPLARDELVETAALFANIALIVILSLALFGAVSFAEKRRCRGSARRLRNKVLYEEETDERL